MCKNENLLKDFGRKRYKDFVFVSVQSDSALTVVENTEGEEGVGDDEEEEVMVDEDDGVLEVVQPTEEWQTLKPGAALTAVLLILSYSKNIWISIYGVCVCVCVCLCVCVCGRPGSASRFSCEAEPADRSEGGHTGRGAA